MIEYRHFRNSDPPHLRRLWHDCQLGRGAAQGFDADIFETVVFSQPYFDPHGLIMAESDGVPVGFLHAGFGPDNSQQNIDRTRGTICLVMVHPAQRRHGIGRELVRRGEHYLSSAGTTCIQAGPSAPCDPFYFGLYGGSQPAGFLASDPAAEPFFQALGYTPGAQRMVLQRQLSDRSSPGGLRLMGVRKSTRLAAPEVPSSRSWWWSTRPGRLDSLELALLPKSGSETLASITVVGLDFYVSRWQQRGIGLMDLLVPETNRRKGLGQALIVEVCRRVREEAITLAEAHVDAHDPGAAKVFTSAGFKQVDLGTVYTKSIANPPA